MASLSAAKTAMTMVLRVVVLKVEKLDNVTDSMLDSLAAGLLETKRETYVAARMVLQMAELMDKLSVNKKVEMLVGCSEIALATALAKKKAAMMDARTEEALAEQLAEMMVEKKDLMKGS